MCWPRMCLVRQGHAAHLPEFNDVRVPQLLVVHDLPLHILADLLPKDNRYRY